MAILIIDNTIKTNTISPEWYLIPCMLNHGHHGFRFFIFHQTNKKKCFFQIWNSDVNANVLFSMNNDNYSLQFHTLDSGRFDLNIKNYFFFHFVKITLTMIKIIIFHFFFLDRTNLWWCWWFFYYDLCMCYEY